MDELTLRKEIAIGFEYSYRHDDWVTPLDEALAGLSAEAALWSPATESKGIWDIVLHMAVWNENIVERVRAQRPAKPAEGNWPSPPAHPDEAAWVQAQDRLLRALESVQDMIRATPVDVVQSGPYGLADLLCRLTHNGYHIGQITKLREWMPS